MKTILLVFVLAACDSTPSHDVVDGPAGIDAAALPDAPAAPSAIPDLRFKWVGAFDAYHLEDQISFASGNVSTTHQGDSFGPITLSQASHGWAVVMFEPSRTPVLPMSSIAATGPVANYEGFLSAVLPRGVVSAVDFTTDSFVLSATTADDPDRTLQPFRAQPTVDGLADYVTATAQAREITTALGLDGDHLDVISYKVATDTADYETSVVDADDSTIEAQATALSEAGYIITAVGRTALSPSRYALVGTRVAGTTAPHAARVTADPTDAMAAGFAIVGMIVRDGTAVSILER